MKSFISIWNRKPLRVIVLIALVLRLIAVIFSQGYGGNDDHFPIIETAQAWVDGTSFQNWLPNDNNDIEENAKGTSFTYVGIHYFVFSAFEAVGIINPTTKMFIIRLLHALFSLLVINYAYRITHLVSNKDMARYVGLLTATFWILPFVSVHNYNEFFTVPFLMLAVWFFLRPQYRDNPLKWAFFGGLVLGFALSIWFFILIYIAGFFAVLFYKKQWKPALMTALGFIISVSIFQGLVDYMIWEKPFVEFYTFLSNLEIPFSKPNRTIFSMYILLLLLVMIPPISILWLVGWVYNAKENMILFFPPFLMILFFSFSIQQHERFLMAVFPFIIIAGVIGWNKYIQRSVFWNNHPGLYKSIVIFFWVVNFLLVFPASTIYSRRAPVKSMLYMQQFQDNISQILVEDSNRKSVKSLPLFYLGKWVDLYKLPKYKEYTAEVNVSRRSQWHFEIKTPLYFETENAKIPDYVLFVGQKRLNERIQRLKPYLPDLQYMKTIKPGIIDRWLYKVNPKHNVNQTIYIYKVKST